MTNTTSFSQTRWSLADLFPGPDSAELQARFGEIEARVSAFEQVRSELRPDLPVDRFFAIVHEIETINELAYRLYGFAGLSFAADTQSQQAQTLQARVQQFFAEQSNRMLFFSLWWKELDDAAAEPFMAQAGEYHYWLEEMRHFKPHTLSEAEEKIINIKDVTGNQALVRLYDAITNRYVFTLVVDGEERKLTRGELMALVKGSDADLRAHAYQELYRVYGNDGPILGQIYQIRVRDWHNEQVQLRNFASPMAVRNLHNDIPDAVVDTLLDVAQANAGVFQRYFRLKARLLGMERLRRYDIYAPIATSEKTYPYGEAVSMVLDAFAQFDAGTADMARRVFAENHIDSEVRKGKRSGAFCWAVDPKLTPWVLVNYQGQVDDISTLAHELGHAVHDMMAARHSILTFHPSLPLAETASTFGEMLLVDSLLAVETDESARRDLLFGQVDDAYATILRQVFFALFERQAHDMSQSGASVDELAEAYLDNLRQQFGDAVEVSDEFRWEWVSIPHIYHTPFYVYAYAFGQLLVLSLYQQYRSEGDAFRQRYLAILAAGGSDAPASILGKAGIDISRREFWQGGFDIIAELVEQLETIVS